MSTRIAMIEDDPTIRELVAKKLALQGYDVSTFENGETLFEQKLDFDLFIVDILLNGKMNGWQVCTAIRQTDAATPILILSALSESSDRIQGLKLGADDYLTKPFEMEELLLRVQGMLKRKTWYQQLPQESSYFHWDNYGIDFVKLEGRKGYDRFEISQKECMLLKLLIEKQGEVVTRDEILDRVWGYQVFPSTRTVDNFILRLRKYFEPDPKHPRYIVSVHGVGYKFNSKVGLQHET